MTRKKFFFRVNIVIILLVLVVLLLSIYYFPTWRCPSDQLVLDSKRKYRLIILILSSPDNLKRRDTIRKTWLADHGYSGMLKYLFAIGTLDILPEQKKTLQSETEKFDDLLLLPTLQDSYNALTRKVLYSFRSIYEYYSFDFLLKCDDDSYVLIHKILKELDQWQNGGSKKELYWGFFNGRAQVKRSGPWKETDWILCDYYLPHALGGGYVLSYNIIKFIANNADILK